ncbi:MAG: hypothetical protein AAFN11_03490 [Chloroflexota bacterium]
MLKRISATFLLVAILMAVASVVSADSWEVLNDGGQCSHETVIFEYDDTGEDGILINTYFVDTGNFAYDLLVTESELIAAGAVYDDNGFLIAGQNAFVDGFRDIAVYFSNNDTPFDLSDDFMSIVVQNVSNPEVRQCIFILDSFADVGPENLRAYEEYNDGTIVFDAGN